MAAETPLLTLPPSSLVEDQGWWCFWRAGPALGVRITGALTDDKNPVWRARLDRHVDEAGYPLFAVLDVREATPAASTPNRVKTAMWTRKMLTHVPRVIILDSGEHEVNFAIKIILRVAGMTNAEVVSDEAYAQKALEQALSEGGAP
jgi:hypothetical protein